MSRKFSVDKNHNPIVAELQQRGLTVEDLASLGKGLPDIVVHKKNGEGATVFVEIKTATGKIKKSQLRFMARWSGFCGFARTADEAYALASNPAKHALTRAQKDKLAAFYTTMAAKEISFSVIEKLLGE